MEEQILEMRKQGKTYNQICRELGCSKATVSYYCGDGQKEKNKKRSYRRRHNNALQTKVENFSHRCTPTSKKLLGNRTRLFQIRDGGGKMVVGYKDVLEKFGINPVCYLTGRPIDFNFPESYNLDHVIPRAKGGDNTLSNMNIACRAANMAKNDLLVSEFLELCEEVLLHHGYQVRRPITPP